MSKYYMSDTFASRTEATICYLAPQISNQNDEPIRSWHFMYPLDKQKCSIDNSNFCSFCCLKY